MNDDDSYNEKRMNNVGATIFSTIYSTWLVMRIYVKKHVHRHIKKIKSDTYATTTHTKINIKKHRKSVLKNTVVYKYVKGCSVCHKTLERRRPKSRKGNKGQTQSQLAKIKSSVTVNKNRRRQLTENVDYNKII